MTDRVDFYVLNGAAPKQRLTFACRLAEKAYLKDLKVVILSETAAESKLLDDLLWTFSDRSFVPHQLCQDEQSIDPDTPVRVTPALEGAGTADLLVNLSERLPAGLERFTRIAEIVDAEPERRRLGRERFKSYRELKVAIETHQVNDTADI